MVFFQIIFYPVAAFILSVEFIIFLVQVGWGWVYILLGVMLVFQVYSFINIYSEYRGGTGDIRTVDEVRYFL